MNPEWLFPSTIASAKETQEELAKKVSLVDALPPKISYVAGLDVSNNRFDPKKMVYAAIVVLSYPELELVESVDCAEPASFHYVTGLLGFREAPPLISAFQKLKSRPDILLVDGHGVSHPRGLGLASHIGLLLDLPTIGVAKSILVGRPQTSLSEEAGSEVPLIWKEREIAKVVRTKSHCLPLIISSGHRISLPTAVNFFWSCSRHYRLAEPIRYAHHAANECRLKNFKT